MSLFTPFTLKIALAALLFCTLYLAVQSIRRRKITSLITCLIIIAIPFIFQPPSSQPEPQPSPEAAAQLIKEQMAAAEWYNHYKKELDALNANWYQYDKTIKAFSNDDISVQTAHVRITNIYAAAEECTKRLNQLTPPPDASETTTMLITSIIQKTHHFATAQTKVFEHSVYATDKNNIRLRPEHDEQVAALERIIALENPIALDIFDDVANLKDHLADKTAAPVTDN